VPDRPARGLRAVIFDVDGTLAETERDGHRVAFNLAFRDHGLPYRWGAAEYGLLLRTPGGRQRLVRYLTGHGHPGPEARELAQALHQAKTAHFLAWIRGSGVRPRPGVHALLRDLRDHGVTVGVATTGSRAWVLPLLARLFGDIGFAAVVTGGDVTRLKPDPQAYLLACHRLRVDPADAVAVEDSPPGLAAAIGAGLRCLVVTSDCTRTGEFPGAAAIVPGYLATDLSGVTVPGCLRSGVTALALRRLHMTAP
jgi:HAD superfamily hydrolase (TIGR01509 family)